MADLRIPRNTLPAPVRPGADAARLEAARAASRAFFQAALAEASPAAEPAPVRAQAATAAPRAPDPARPLRPGSIIDIKV
jgi:hypothetical protein